MGNIPYPLTAEQKAVAMAPPDQPQLVLAPPGSGKTHTAIARIIYLIEECSIHPGSELLVLCFTRAAVREIMSRLTDLVEDLRVHDDLRFVSIRTFDSFATRLLLQVYPDIELRDEGYDQRIEHAIMALSSPDSPASRLVQDVRHLIVDEIQDLVGVRARLVMLLMQRISGGFTLLGDPAQSIYGFTLKRDGEGPNTDALLQWIRGQPWAPALLEKDLHGNQRAGGEIATRAASLREAILSADRAGVEALSRLSAAIADLRTSGSGMSPDADLSRLDQGDVCVLCRTNGEMLQVASMLTSKGVPVSLRAGPEDSALPPWISRVFGGWTHRRIAKHSFLTRWGELIGQSYDPDGHQAWRWLKRIEGNAGDDLDLRMLHRALHRGQRLADDADAFLCDSHAVNLSTIHAAKGQEFDRVVILESEDSLQPEDAMEEARVLYVAATRARIDLSRLERKGIPHLWKMECLDGRVRWIARQPHNGYHFLELGLSGDFDPISPVSTWLFSEPSGVARSQEHLWHSVRPGDIMMARQMRRGRHRFYYLWHETDAHDAVLMGQLSLNFLRDLKYALSTLSDGRWSYPRYFKGIHVAAVVTEVLPPYPENVHAPYGSSGFCLGLRLRGMVYLLKE